MPQPTATVVPIPSEPYPLRQVFPETLYWTAESITNEDGSLSLDLPLAHQITTWRLVAVASTQEGELGYATYDILVFQDFFIEVDTPTVIAQGEEAVVTVTLHNFLPQGQSVQILPIPADWYTVVAPTLPMFLNLPLTGDAATTQFTIRAEQAGTFSLQVAVVGEQASDAVALDVTVEE